jgi:hypothetical protein
MVVVTMDDAETFDIEALRCPVCKQRLDGSEHDCPEVDECA